MRALLAILLVAASLGAASAQESGAAAPAVPPAVGIAVPLTGEYAPLGKQLVQAAQLAGRETGLRIVVADTAGEPAQAVAAVQSLAGDPTVVAVVGPVGHRESSAAAAAAQRAGIPLFTLSTASTVNEAGGWVFRVRASPEEQARALAEVARANFELKSAAILYPQTEYGQAAATAFADEFLRRGGRVTAVANYPEEMTNYTDVLDVLVGKKVYLGKGGTVDRWKTDASGFARLRSKPVVDFDTLFIPDFHTRVARILPFLPLSGIQNGDGGEGVAVQLLGLAGWQGSAMELAGGVAAGAVYLDTFAGDAAGGRAEEFSRTFEEATGRRPVDIEAETFDVVWLLGTLAAGAPALEGARAAVVRRLPFTKDWTGVTGALRFGRSGEPLRRFGVYRFDSDGAVAPLF